MSPVKILIRMITASTPIKMVSIHPITKPIVAAVIGLFPFLLVWPALGLSEKRSRVWLRTDHKFFQEDKCCGWHRMRRRVDLADREVGAYFWCQTLGRGNKPRGRLCS